MSTPYNLAIYYMIFACISLCTAAIDVMKVMMTVTPTDDVLIPVVFELQDDNIVEPVDFYQLTIVNVSDPNVMIGDFNTTIIIVNDDDEIIGEGKKWITKNVTDNLITPVPLN